MSTKSTAFVCNHPSPSTLPWPRLPPHPTRCANGCKPTRNKYDSKKKSKRNKQPPGRPNSNDNPIRNRPPPLPIKSNNVCTSVPACIWYSCPKTTRPIGRPTRTDGDPSHSTDNGPNPLVRRPPRPDKSWWIGPARLPRSGPNDNDPKCGPFCHPNDPNHHHHHHPLPFLLPNNRRPKQQQAAIVPSRQP